MSQAHRWPFVLAGVIVAALALLAKMQIDRIAQLSQNREQRERAELESAARRFAGDIDFEVARIGAMFEVHENSGGELAERYERWRATAPDPRVLGAIFVIQPPTAFRFDPEQRTMRVTELPPEVAQVLANGNFPPRFVPEIPAVTFPIREHPRELLLLQIDVAYLEHHTMPDMARRLFGAEYDVAVARGDQLVFRSDSKWPASVAAADPDVVGPLFSMRERRREREERPPTPPPPLWRVLVRHHGPSLGEVIAAGRRREIAVTSLILILLGAVAITLAIAARRAERLRRQQLEFVAGITHELNTPLAALGAAGQNLVDGIAGDTTRYGEAIVKETRRLIDLVDQ